MKEPHEEVLDLLYQALDKIKKLPLKDYDGAKVVGAMINVETTIDSLENNAEHDMKDWRDSIASSKEEWPE